MNGAPYVNNAGVFLVQTLFGFYIVVIMLRFLLQTVRADFYNPLVQFLVKLTNPPLVPLRRYIPGLWGLDMASIVLMLAVQFVELWLVFYLVERTAHLGGLLVLSVAELLQLLINVFFWAVLIQVILSWVNPNPYNPAVVLVRQLTEPVMRPARRLLPPISGIDLSPILVLIALQLASLLLVAPLRDMGFGLT
ncbi:MAG: YggT family protein [Pseudomonadota bacterium]|nr:YggT family protein [Pseudomonadota bacterium]